MSELADYQFKTVAPTSLTLRQLRQLEALTRESLALDFAGRPRQQRNRLVAFSNQYRRDLNGMPGTPQFGAAFNSQRFSKAEHVLAIRKGTDRVVAAVPVADQVSSRLIAPFNQFEMAAKLRLDKLVHRRYYWAGLCVLSQEARLSLANTSPEEASVTDVMLTLGTQHRLGGQPATAYPYDQEKPWMNSLASLGYDWVTDIPSIRPFGEDTPKVGLSLWRANSVAQIQHTAMQKIGMAEALRAAGVAVSV